MESNEWEFNQRTDGQLSLNGNVSDVAATVLFSSVGSDSVFLESASASASFPLADEFFSGSIARIEMNGDTNYAETAFRLSSYVELSNTLVQASMSERLYQAVGATDASLYWSEYILPDTVAAVTRVRYQEYPLTLENVDPTMEYDEIFPRPHIEYGPPEMVSVGGFDVATWQNLGSVTSAPSPGLRVAVWPVPDEKYVLHYSYTYRHPELVEDDDVLEGVPPNIVSRIVDLAATDMKIYFDKDEMAMKLRLHNMNDIRRANAKQGGSRAARKPIGNWDGSAARGKRFRDGFNGKLIGDY